MNFSGNRFRPTLILALALLVAVGISGAFAQSEDAAGEPASTTTMGAGDIDVAASGGLGGLIYPFIEPQVAVGLVPLGPVTLSVGAVGDAGYCLFCGLLRVLTNDWALRAYYFGVYGRVLAHFSSLSDVLGDSTPIDPYAGLAVGPRWYVVGVEYRPTGDSSTASLNSIIIAPQVGTRLFFDEDANWFGFAEARYLFEVGFQTQTVEAGAQTYTVTDDYAGGGGSVSLGVGMRL